MKKILHITCQKSNSTGSGIYMTELIKAFDKKGYKQAIIYGENIEEKDKKFFPSNIEEYPVYFGSEELPYNICGMSDIMPYKSKKFKELSQEETMQYKNVFRKTMERAEKIFQPHLIICNHLYIVTAIAREVFADKKVIGICHGTCLRQIKSHNLEEEFIKKNIKNLDKIMSLHKKQSEDIVGTFNIESEKVLDFGAGYNQDLFNYNNEEKEDIILYAGKLSKSKGIEFLINSMEYMKNPVKLYIAGSSGDKTYYEYLKKLSEKYEAGKINFLGKLNQKELAYWFKKGKIFVLPSFYEGLPLVILEAQACNMNIVYTELDGSMQWFKSKLQEDTISFVKLPGTLGDDQDIYFDRESFERELAEKIDSQYENFKDIDPSVIKSLSWEGMCDRIVMEIIKNR